LRSRNLLLALAICVALAAPGCRPPAGEPGPGGSDRGGSAPLIDPTAVLDKEVLYLGPNGPHELIVDPSDDDRLYSLSDANADPLRGIAPFSEVTLTLNTYSGTVFLSTRLSPAQRNVPVVTAAGAEEAAQLYPPALMDCFLFTSHFADYGVEDYNIKSSAVIAAEGNRATIEFVVDLKPAIDPFSTAGSRWGEPGDDGYVRDRRLVLSLYTNGSQYCAYNPDWRNIFSEGAPAPPRTPRETLYKPVVHSNAWEDLTEGHAYERVLWEDETYSFITHVRLIGPSDRQYLELTVYRIERATDDRLALFDVLRDVFELTPIALRDRTLYLHTTKAFPNSEGFSSHITSLDLDTGEYTILLTEPNAVLGKVGDTIYIAQLGDDKNGLFALNSTTGELKRVSDLPGPSYSATYEAAWLKRYVGGRLFIFWPDPADMGLHKLYSVDPESGTIREEP